MSATPLRPVITARNLIAFVVIDVVLFLAANMTAKNSSHPGTVSNVFWGGFLIGAAALILLAVVALVRKLPAAR
jgi:choline-glycine betaine transporter